MQGRDLRNSQWAHSDLPHFDGLDAELAGHVCEFSFVSRNPLFFWGVMLLTWQGIEANGWQTYDFIRARGNADSFFFKSIENISTDRIFQRANVVCSAKKSDGDFKPVISNAE